MKAWNKKLLGLAAALLAAYGFFVGFWKEWDQTGALPAEGGLYFPWAVELKVPSFAQADDRWRHDKMGDSPGTLGSEGCAVTSAAMALAFYGIDVDPQRLNRFLSENCGYTERGWIYWEAAAEFSPGKVFHAYEDLPSYRLMDWNLMRGNPVIVRIRPYGKGTHFVLVTGKRGRNYLAQDPGSGGRLVGLESFESKIEALRFYERVR